MTDLFFQAGRAILNGATQVFFSRIDVTGEKPVSDGALIIVSNHPNMLIDSLLVLKTYKRSLWFVAKSTLFKRQFTADLLKAAHLIPIYRVIDGSDTDQNKDSFKTVIQKLYEGKAVAIFPEGVSTDVRKILSLKTGAARIAFEAEAGKDFALCLRIQPIGITYSDPVSFKSSVTVHLGAPIKVADFHEEYKDAPRAAVRKLTEHLEKKLKEITVEVPENSERILADKIGKLYSTAAPDREKLSIIAKNVCAIAPVYPDRAREIERRIDAVLEFAEGADQKQSARTAVLFPLLLIGMGLHYLPYRLVGRLANGSAPYRERLASNKLLYGIIIFPLWSILCGLIVAFITRSFALGILMVICSIALAILVSKYFNQSRLHFLSLFFSDRAQTVKILKENLISELNEMRVS
jgi:1-acyl-sn-glycerol-3-phosphate acyltransferase